MPADAGLPPGAAAPPTEQWEKSNTLSQDEAIRGALETLSAFIPHPDDFTRCITACVAMQDSRQSRIHAAYWTLRAASRERAAALPPTDTEALRERMETTIAYFLQTHHVGEPVSARVLSERLVCAVQVMREIEEEDAALRAAAPQQEKSHA